MLEQKTAACVILHMKSMFARHGIPSQIMSDNMPFASQLFNNFAKEWGIKLTTSSPLYSQSNGQSERAVQTIKNLLKKASEEGRDPYLALMAYRNTPVTGMSYSPAQMLMSRSLNTKVSKGFAITSTAESGRCATTTRTATTASQSRLRSRSAQVVKVECWRRHTCAPQ